MNNTTKKRRRTTLLAIVAIFMAATLVVGTAGSFIVTTKTAFAASNNNKSGNTITAQINRQHSSGSGFDNDPEQEAQNTICTHPASGASCVSENEGAATTTATTPVTPATGTLLVKKVEVCVLKVCPVLSDFTITVTGNNPTPSTFPASVSGTLVTLGTGAFSVKENSLVSGFTTTFSADCSATIAPGDQKTCTVTNTQQEA